MLGDLAIDYAQRSVTLAGRPVRLLPMEYRMPKGEAEGGQ